MAGYFILEKCGSRHTSIIDAHTREVLCQLRNREAAGWVYRATKSRDFEAAYAIEARAVRVANARAYLAIRAAREADRGVQLSLF